VQIGRPRILSQGLFDLAQVEVLKGPQALFFGKNSPAGVLSLKSADPGDHLEAFLRTNYEFVADEAVVEGAISSPITEDFGARLAVRYRKMKGWMRNTAGPLNATNDPFVAAPGGIGDPGYPVLGSRRSGEEELLGRLTLKYKPASSPFDATLKLSASDYSDDGPDGNAQPTFCGNAPAGVTYGATDPYGDCKADNHFSRSGLPDGVADNWPFAKQQPYTSTHMYLGALTANYEMDNLKLTSVTGYLKINNKVSDNFDGTSFYQLGAAEHEDYKSFSQELRLVTSFDGPLNMVVGAYYQDTDLEFVNNSKILNLGADPALSPADAKYHTWEKLGITKGKTYSGFGQLIWNIVPTVELAGGVRYTRETKDSQLSNTYVHSLAAGLLSPVGRILRANFKDTNWSPEATLTWRPSTNLTTYVAYKTGYKSGGFGLSAVLIPPTIGADEIAFSSEKVKGYEIGLKGQLLDRRVTFSIAAYNYKYDNLQVNSYNPATLSFVIDNAAAARVKGIEFETRAKVIEGVSLYGSVAYNRARYSSFVTSCYGGQVAATGCNVSLSNGADGLPNTADDAFGQSLKGGQFPRAPDWSASAGFNASVPLGEGLALDLDGNARYSGSYFYADNGNPGGRQNSYWLLDGAARVNISERWQIGVIGRNLTNKYFVVQGLEKPGAPAVAGVPTQIIGNVSRGRQVSLEATFRY
jgi:outer membrane receptor protein involved in Fe transport